MPTTWIDVVDTAVKIGFGAVIAWASSYLLAKVGHRQTLWRDFAAKKFSLLQDACSEAENYFSFATSLFNVVADFAVANQQAGRIQTQEESAAIERAHAKFDDAKLSRDRATADAALLGAADMRKHLDAFIETLGRFRKIVLSDNKMLSNDELHGFLDQFRANRRAFYAAANAFLEKLGNG